MKPRNFYKLLPLKSLFGVISLCVGLVNAHAQTASRSGLCEDAGVSICSRDIKPEAPIAVAKIIRSLAVQAVDQFLGLKLSEAQFFQSLRSGMKLSRNENIRKRVLLYMSCADYLARARFSGVTASTCFDGVSHSSHDIENAILYLDHQSFPKTAEVFLKAKQLVTEAVQATAFSASLKADLLHELNGLANPSLSGGVDNSIEQAMETSGSDRTIISEQAEICPYNLTDVNAFRQMNNLIICPSVWIDAMVSSSESNDGITYSTLTHEMGHVIGGRLAFDSVAFQNHPFGKEAGVGFNETLSCMGDYLSSNELKLNLSPDLTSAERSKVQTQLAGKTPSKLSEFFYQEYSADSVSADAMAIYFHELPASIDRDAILRRNLRSLCGPGDASDEAIQDSNLYLLSLHPAPRFRMRETYLGNPHLRAELGCSRRPAAACSVLAP